MSSFFTVPASQKKRKRADGPSAPTTKRRSTTTSTSSRPQQSRRSQLPANKRQGKHQTDDDESISGSDSEDERAGKTVEENEEGDSDDAAETAAERRLRLAERYLENIRAEVEEGDEIGFDAADIDRDLISARLKEDVEEDQGKLYRRLAGELDYTKASQTMFRADTLATTAVATCSPYIYTASKDMTLIKWELPSAVAAAAAAAQTQDKKITKQTQHSRRRKPKQVLYTRGSKRFASDPSYQHHTAPILCVAASTDGRFVVTGGADRKLIIWDAATLKPLKVYTHHRDAVTSLAFRGKTNQLYSASKDRTIKIWSLNELAYVETLFGHQDEVVDISAVGGREERCVSVGARDRSARVWKVVEESQLVFRGGAGGKSELDERIKDTLKMGKKWRGKPKDEIDGGDGVVALTNGVAPPSFKEGSLDRVLQLSTQLFVTGSDSGALSLFALHKKKPLHVLPLAHGYDPALSSTLSSAEIDAENRDSQAQPTARWITALAGIPGCDLFVTGSWDGCVRVWRISADDRKIESVGVLGEGVTATKTTFEEEDAHRPNGVNTYAGSPTPSVATTTTNGSGMESGRIRGIINDLAVFPLGERSSNGVCIVAAVGTETRLGRWIQKKGKNGAVVFEVSMLPASSKMSTAVNGEAKGETTGFKLLR